MVIIGIDPGLAHTGYSILDCGTDRPEVMETGVVRTPAALPLEKRLHQLHRSCGGVSEYLLQDHHHKLHRREVVVVKHHVVGAWFTRGDLFLYNHIPFVLDTPIVHRSPALSII